MRTIFVLVATIATAVLFTMTMGKIRAMQAQLDAINRPAIRVGSLSDTYINGRKIEPGIYRLNGATITVNGEVLGAKGLVFDDADYRERRSNPYRLNMRKEGAHD